MAIAFTYTKSTNIAVVTGGTSGTPALFSDFVTADRAGSVTLLAATAGLSPTLALTYQITPVEKLALLISFVVASKTTQTDYIFITGTDAWDAAQTESIDVSAGNGTYVSTKRFRTITNIDCSDNSAGGGTDWADGTVAVTQPQWGVIWDYGNGQYRVDSDLDIGNGSTSTYFASSQENVYFNTNKTPQVTTAATLTIGAASNTYSGFGSVWLVWGMDTTRPMMTGGVTYIYGSILRYINSNLRFAGGDLYIYDSKVDSINGNNLRLASPTIIHFRNVYLYNVYSFTVYSGTTLTEFTDIWLETSNSGYNVYTNFTFISPKATNASYQYAIQTQDTTLTIIDAIGGISNTYCDSSRSKILEVYTCNINVCDKDGTPISGAVVDCVDTAATACWTAGTVTTDASGNIVAQNITYKQFYGATPVITTYSPHKFTISKSGYQTLVLDAITVDGPIKWHLELQQPSAGGAAYKNIGIGVNL